MARLPSSFWGPPPQWALIPLVAVGVVLGAVAFRQPKEGGGPVAVTALKPLEPETADRAGGSGLPAAEVAAGMPIVVRYGGPSPRTARLWAEPLPG